MLIAIKGNREYSIDPREKSRYETMGYKVIEVDDKGNAKNDKGAEDAK
jgi:hypothetical protein